MTKFVVASGDAILEISEIVIAFIVSPKYLRSKISDVS